MSFHVRCKGSLRFADVAAARRALAAIVANKEETWFLRDAMSLAGRTLRVHFDDFVSHSGDSSVTDAAARLQAAAVDAEAGSVSLRSESDEELIVRAPRKAMGRKAKRAGGGVRFGARGALTFSDDASAASAYGAVVAPFEGDAPNGVRLKGKTLALNWSGEADENLIFAARRALFAILPRATTGDVRFRYLVTTTDMHAPVAAFGSEDDRVEYVHIAGALSFESPQERASFRANLAPSAWSTTERLATGLLVHGEAKMTQATFDALIKSTQASVRRARSGTIAFQSSWGFRQVTAKRR